MDAIVPLQPPRGGISRQFARQNQPPFTTPDALNCRPRDVFELRDRPGTRSGMAKKFTDELGSGSVVDLLDTVTTADDTALFVWRDQFDRDALGGGWSAASWLSGAPLATKRLGGFSNSTGENGAVAVATDLDTSSDYTVGVYIVPSEGTYSGTWKIFARMDDSSPNVTTGGVSAQLTLAGTAYSGKITVDGSTDTNFTSGTGSLASGWFRLSVSGNNVSCTWQGTEVLASTAIAAATGDRVGFSMTPTNSGDTCLISEFRVTGSPTTATTEQERRIYLVAASNGSIYDDSGELEAMSLVQAGVVPTDFEMTSAELLQKLYIATGTTPVVYDPSAGTAADLTASAGSLPTSTVLVERYRERIVLSTEYAWYMSAMGDATDWDYTATAETGAVSGVNSEAGVPGERIVAMKAYADDLLVFGCLESMYVMRGDPRAGGVLDKFSHTQGVIGPRALCFGPSGELYFMSKAGLFVAAPGMTIRPESLSRDLPDDLRGIDTNQYRVNLIWDNVEDGLRIFVSGEKASSADQWFFDAKTGRFWRDSYSRDYEAFSCVDRPEDDGGVILGCRDGYLRQFLRQAPNDDGTAFASHFDVGPVFFGGEDGEAIVTNVSASLARGSGDVTWTMRSGDSGEEAYNADGSDYATGTWSADGYNYDAAVRFSGHAHIIRVSSTGGTPWALQGMTAYVTRSGKRRKA